eukprot:TRINITY_DN25522_c0_g1_i1.p1 TRINITY_DN25522_c0_g1~~TRINITY_DN25522_c0_g1_i1.p1  ORF type:complete len:579 (+),score=66.60 TRINITY_DN25522_c0_g1_i1:27-1739(+)
MTAPPWLAQYDASFNGLAGEIALSSLPATLLDALTYSLCRKPDVPLCLYYGTSLTVRQIDDYSTRLARGLLNYHQWDHGARIALFMQNVPQYLIALVAVWKLGAVGVNVSPMLTPEELHYILHDSGAVACIALSSLLPVVKAVRTRLPLLGVVVYTSEHEFLPEGIALPPVFSPRSTSSVFGAVSFQLLLEEGSRVQTALPPPPTASDVAFLTYTSGTTGPSKGAMNSHRNVVFNAESYRRWMALTETDIILGVAPMFHITGLIAHLAVSVLLPIPVVYVFRFHAPTTARLVERFGATFTVAAITAYIAMMNAPGITAEQLRSLRKAYSGGAPISPSTLQALRDRVGLHVRPIYGLTETTSQSHGTPLGKEPRVDAATGATSIGVPMFNTFSRIVDSEGRTLPAMEHGEIAISGPQVVPGYWQKPEETKRAFGNTGELLTGDIGFMDRDGWFYVVDRKKDLIIASGYKVWPKEVEDALYAHHAVREAAVVGVSDEYRGEDVVAFVSLRDGTSATPAELVAFCHDRLAAYKRPRRVFVLPEIPKNAAGKILRRELRNRVNKEKPVGLTSRL